MPEECSCGRFYFDQNGVNLCMRNGHGQGQDKFGDKYRLTNQVMPYFTIVCADCGRPLRSRLRGLGEGNIEFDVLPHVCEVEAPGEGVAA